MKLQQDDLRRVLDDDGHVIKGAQIPTIPDADLVRLYDHMMLVRIMDDRMMRLQRQGRIAFYMKSVGEEATHFAVYALRADDWFFPSYREQGAWFWRGYSVEDYIHQLFGNDRDPIKGRQMPVHHSHSPSHCVSISSPVGTQIPQAVGAAQAMRIAGTDQCALTFFGEGTSSTGEFHVAMNFAGVMKAPVVLICRNNGWAISVPREKQTAAKTFASKAVGYGMPGVRVDGNDILAVIQASQEAVARARAGDGPTMLELLTYRVQGHSSSDDPTAYRDPNEPETWELRDPVRRFRTYLQDRDLWSEKLESDITDKHNDEITRVTADAAECGTPPVESMFDDVFEDLPWHLAEQRDYLLAQPRTKSPHAH
ncbi:MAG TPA: thiamine pyrophosphate-dependent enzyme [Kofleriaceae bacterium]|nr:thiamine pyrophosphate-dependent enzyme [Kofleriaceae bacterium]